MASQAVNVNSVLNYIATQSGLPIDIVRNWFPNEPSKRSFLLNIQSAYNIINKVLEIGFGTTKSIPLSAQSQQSCSVNTLKSIYSYIFSGKTWNVQTSYGSLKYGSTCYVLNDQSVSALIVGGSGGGSGGLKDNFDGSGSLTIPAGASGARSSIYVNGTLQAQASGGTGGAGQTSSKGGRAGTAGFSGSSGERKTVSLTFKAGDAIVCYNGYGGGGSGGGSIRVGKNGNLGDLTAPGPVGPNGSNGYGAVSGSYNVGCGGGGAGGDGFDDSNIQQIGKAGEGKGNSSYNSGSKPSYTDRNYVGTSYPGGSGGSGTGDGSAGSGGSGGVATTSSTTNAGGGGIGGNGSSGGGGGGASGLINLTPQDICYINLV